MVKEQERWGNLRCTRLSVAVVCVLWSFRIAGVGAEFEMEDDLCTRRRTACINLWRPQTEE